MLFNAPEMSRTRLKTKVASAVASAWRAMSERLWGMAFTCAVAALMAAVMLLMEEPADATAAFLSAALLAGVMLFAVALRAPV